MAGSVGDTPLSPTLPHKGGGSSYTVSRLVVVSNRVAPIQEGEPTAGGLAAGVLDALKQQGGVWFGWSGEVNDGAAPPTEQTVGPIKLVTIDLERHDYDQFYRG